MENNKDFATVRTFDSLEEAWVIKGLLDSVGIESQVINETVARMIPVMGDIGLVRIVVNAADYERAVAALEADFERE